LDIRGRQTVVVFKGKYVDLIVGLSNYIGRESKVWGDSGEDSIMRQEIETQDYWHRGCYYTGY
jgi:hypothetical protein